MAEEPQEITALLGEARRGNAEAEGRLADLVYAELHRMAKQQMSRERADHTLQPTVLVNEAFLRLVRYGGGEWANRKHFFVVAATLMRRILIDHARQFRAQKRGSGGKISLDSAIGVSGEMSDELLALDEALERLAALDERQSRIVELRFFAGLTEEEIADVLGVTARTVKRDWKTARAWLHTQIAGREA